MNAIDKMGILAVLALIAGFLAGMTVDQSQWNEIDAAATQRAHDVWSEICFDRLDEHNADQHHFIPEGSP